MGNSNSQSVQLAHPPHNWAHSYPRDVHKQKLRRIASPENKVLPTRIPGQRLRVTNNGVILNSGGTLTKRCKDVIEDRPNPDDFSHDLGPTVRNSHSYIEYNDLSGDSGREYADKKYESEPDLRDSKLVLSSPEVGAHTLISESPSKHRIKSRKKYKAPPPPPSPIEQNGYSSTLPKDMNRTSSEPSDFYYGAGMRQVVPCVTKVQNWGERQNYIIPVVQSGRRKDQKIMRLFKTKAESRKCSRSDEIVGASEFEYRRAGSEQRYLRAISEDRQTRKVSEDTRQRARSMDCIRALNDVETGRCSGGERYNRRNYNGDLMRTQGSAKYSRSLSSLGKEKISGARPAKPERKKSVEHLVLGNESRTSMGQSGAGNNGNGSKRNSRLDAYKEPVHVDQKTEDNIAGAWAVYARTESSKNSTESREKGGSSRDKNSTGSRERHCVSSTKGSPQVSKDTDATSTNMSKLEFQAEIKLAAQKRNSNSGNCTENDDTSNISCHSQKMSTTAQSHAETVENKVNISCSQKMITDSKIAVEKKIENVDDKKLADTGKLLEKQDSPTKTFFFGMGPDNSDLHNRMPSPSRGEIRINGERVEYRRRDGKEYKTSVESYGESQGHHRIESRDMGFENTDHSRSNSRDANAGVTNSHTRSYSKDLNNNGNTTLGHDEGSSKQHIIKYVEEFAAKIEKEKHHCESSSNREERMSSSSYKGRHSRQDSGNVHITGHESSVSSDDELDISVQLRPILPKKKREIPRFSPTAAWRSLSLDTITSNQKERSSDRSQSSEEGDVFEDRIQRHTRPVAPPRNNNEKSGDSGISGDAGSPGPVQDFEPLTHPEKMKHSEAHVPPLAVSSPIPPDHLTDSEQRKHAWTPDQDLDDLSTGGASGENSSPNSPNQLVPSGMTTPPKFTSRANMFPSNTQSLPRIDMHKTDYVTEEKIQMGKKGHKSKWKKKNADSNAPNKLNSLRKLKRSMSGALDAFRNKSPEGRTIEENWYLSHSAPTSLNSGEILENWSNYTGSNAKDRRLCSPPVLVEFPEKLLFEDSKIKDIRAVKSDLGVTSSATQQPKFQYNSLYSRNERIMYLPEYNSRMVTSGQERRRYSDDFYKYKKKGDSRMEYHQRSHSADMLTNDSHEDQKCSKSTHLLESRRKLPVSSRGRETLPVMEDRMSSPATHYMRSASPYYPYLRSQSAPSFVHNSEQSSYLYPTKSSSPPTGSSSPDDKGKVYSGKKKGKKFTFQSTVRQQERRKLEEKLTREAEEKEQQRLREIEAMRKVEEEFQRKRASEKAKIRNQLRVFNLQINSGEHDSNKLVSVEEKLGGKKKEESKFIDPDVQNSSFSSVEEQWDSKARKKYHFGKEEKYWSNTRYDKEYRYEFRVGGGQGSSTPPPPPTSPPPTIRADDFPQHASLPPYLCYQAAATGSPSSSNTSHTSADPQQKGSPGLFGFTKWIKRKGKEKEDISKSSTDMSKELLNPPSPTRQEPDGAPSPSHRKNSDEFRQEIINAAKSRNGAGEEWNSRSHFQEYSVQCVKATSPERKKSIYKHLSEVADREDRLKQEHTMSSKDKERDQGVGQTVSTLSPTKQNSKDRGIGAQHSSPTSSVKDSKDHGQVVSFPSALERCSELSVSSPSASDQQSKHSVSSPSPSDKHSKHSVSCPSPSGRHSKHPISSPSPSGRHSKHSASTPSPSDQHSKYSGQSSYLSGSEDKQKSRRLTQELSEFKEERRDYRDYRRNYHDVGYRGHHHRHSDSSVEIFHAPPPDDMRRLTPCSGFHSPLPEASRRSTPHTGPTFYFPQSDDPRRPTPQGGPGFHSQASEDQRRIKQHGSSFDVSRHGHQPMSLHAGHGLLNSDVPRSPSVPVSDNYRRDFAHGVPSIRPKPNSVEDSDTLPSDSDTSNSRRISREVHSAGSHSSKQHSMLGDAQVRENALHADSQFHHHHHHSGMVPRGSGMEEKGGTPVQVFIPSRNVDYMQQLNGSPARFAFTPVRPFSPSKGFRPVAFTPGSSSQKVPQTVN